MSQCLTGHGIGSGIVSGPARVMSSRLTEPEDIARVNDAAVEKASAHRAVAFVTEQLGQLADASDGVAADILRATALIAADPTLLTDINARIDAGKTAERAIYEALLSYQETLTAMGGYMAERAQDLDDVSGRLRAYLQGTTAPGIPLSEDPYILVAADLSPADTVSLDPSKILGLVTEGGTPTSHTAIIARTLAIPAIVGVTGALSITDDDVLILDAKTGDVLIGASEQQVEQASLEAQSRKDEENAYQGPGKTKDGHPVQLLANIGSPEDAVEALAQNCEGVGLLRTEFLFLSNPQPPQESVQVEDYTAIMQHFAGQKVVARLLDAGADKPLPYLGFDEEQNPALGVRGYRALKRNPDILRTQLEALNKAAQRCQVKLWVMAPMITDAEEAKTFTELAHQLGIEVAGVMAEVPGVAILADQLVQVTDFVSIGTNDLSQYTLGADRLLGALASYQNPWHPAVLRLVKGLGTHCNASNTPLGVCGEAAADPQLAAVLVGLGVNSLSMAPTALAPVRTLLAKVPLTAAQEAAAAALEQMSADAAKDAAEKVLKAAC